MKIATKNQGHFQAFNKEFFNQHQATLLKLVNGRLTRKWFRYVLRIDGDKSPVGDNLITRIEPNAIRWGNTWEFRTHPKFGKRIYYAFRPFWWTLHFWDWLIAERFLPKYSFGLLILTVYPDANPET